MEYIKIIVFAYVLYRYVDLVSFKYLLWEGCDFLNTILSQFEWLFKEIACHGDRGVNLWVKSIKHIHSDVETF